MSIELPVRPANAAVEQANEVMEVIESGVAKAGASLGSAIDRLGEQDWLGEIDLDETVREAAGRLRSQADEVLKDLEASSEQERLALVASIVLVVILVLGFVLFMRRRESPVRKPARTKGGPKR